jgi:hypothetical protein
VERQAAVAAASLTPHREVLPEGGSNKAEQKRTGFLTMLEDLSVDKRILSSWLKPLKVRFLFPYNQEGLD